MTVQLIDVHVIFSVKSLLSFFCHLLQPPPTYEESIRQSVELPYNILSSSLDVPSAQSFYTNTRAVVQTNTAPPANLEAADNTVLPV